MNKDWSARTQGMAAEDRDRWEMGEKSFPVRWGENLWLLHPWRSSLEVPVEFCVPNLCSELLIPGLLYRGNILGRRR